MFKMLSYVPDQVKSSEPPVKFSGKKLHPTRSLLMEAGRNLVRNMPDIHKTPAVTNTMDQSLAGQTIIVTGATSGLGRVLAEDCAVRGGRLIMAVRDVDAGSRVMTQILESAPNADIDVYHLDLTSFESVRTFAEEVMQNEEKIDVLINNAATMCDRRKVTEDQHEETIQVNFYSPVMLTMLLLDFMSRTSNDARVIFVSSMAHGFAKELFLKDMEWKYFPKYNPFAVYAHSKLALMLFVRELSRRADVRNVRCYAADPGISLTGISRHVLPEESFWSKFKFLIKPFHRTTEHAAQSILSVVLMEKYGHNPDVYYFTDGKEIPCSRVAQNDDKAAELWFYTKDALQLPAMDLLPITSNV
jgi:retinol dehydrogenase-13